MDSDAENPLSPEESNTEQQPSKKIEKSKTEVNKKGYFLSKFHERQKPWVQKFLGINEVFEDLYEFFLEFEAEYWGTFFLVFFGASSCMKYDAVGAGSALWPNLLTISLTFGLAVASMAQVLGHTSGAHMNPAVTFGLMVGGECGLCKFLFFFIIQTFGAFMGAGCAETIIPDAVFKADGGATKALSMCSGAQWQGMMCEATITMMFLWVILAVVDKTRDDCKGSGPLAIGLALTLGHLAGIPVSGASMNPARSLGPLIGALIFKSKYKKYVADPDAVIGRIDKASSDIWVYIIGPLLGALMAGGIYRMRFRGEKVKRRLKMLQNQEGARTSEDTKSIKPNTVAPSSSPA